MIISDEESLVLPKKTGHTRQWQPTCDIQIKQEYIDDEGIYLNINYHVGVQIDIK